MSLDMTDRKLLNMIQASFPLVGEPYREMGERLGIGEGEVLERIGSLKRRGLLREINAIFDTRHLGYKSSLVAMRFPPERLHRAALRINRHPGVSHNYARDSYFNLWFTLALPPDGDLEATVEQMARETEAESYRLMPALRLFKIGVNFDMVEEKGASYQGFSADTGLQDWDRVEPLTDWEVKAVRELQRDLPLVSRPFDDMARRLGLTTSELLSLARSFLERGVMRRYGAVLHHRKAGFKASAMGVWKVPPQRSEEVGRTMASHPAVSHCYERPAFPDWPYTHFTMIHATSRQGCALIAREISRRTGITDFMLLYSTREYKKARVRYFV